MIDVQVTRLVKIRSDVPVFGGQIGPVTQYCPYSAGYWIRVCIPETCFAPGTADTDVWFRENELVHPIDKFLEPRLRKRNGKRFWTRAIILRGRL